MHSPSLTIFCVNNSSHNGDEICSNLLACQRWSHCDEYVVNIRQLLAALAYNHGAPLSGELVQDQYILGFVGTYLGVQEINRNSQEEDEHKQGEQLVQRVRYRE
jgi:hypothetical protein